MRILSSTPSIFRAAQRELALASSPLERQLLEQVGLNEFLACAAVLKRERVAGRILLPQERVEQILAVLSALGLCCLRSAFDYLSAPSAVQGTSHDGGFAPRGRFANALCVVYFGLGPEFVEGAEFAETNSIHELAGKLFGYPDCCTRFFAESTAPQLDKAPLSIARTGPFPRHLNPVLPYLYGLSLLFHFPCSPQCRASLALLAQRRKELGRLAPSSLRLSDLGAGMALYGPEVGIALATRYQRLDATTYFLEEVLVRHTHTRELFAETESTPYLKLHSAHHFCIGGRAFSGDAYFAAQFV